jgi:membrane protease subunit HflK
MIDDDDGPRKQHKGPIHMAWNSQGGGGGPWGGGGGGGGPWGGRGPQGPTPPDFEEMLRRGQDRLKRFMPGGAGTGRGLALIILVAVAIWLATGFYRVQPDEQGVVMLFGRWVATTEPGLNWYFPAPIGRTLTPKVLRINRVDVGFRGVGDLSRINSARDVPEESLMLTGDQNIADVDFTVFWRIKDAGEYLFNIRDPEGTVKVAAESAMREVVGQSVLQDALTGGRQRIEQDTLGLLQEIMDSYKSGITITQVQLLKVDPPAQVIDAFNEVQRARQDKARKQNEAEAYRNKVVPTARGAAAQIVQDAEAYKEKVVKDAEGEANRFLALYKTYQKAQDITEQRLYLEAMEEVLGRVNKIVIDEKGMSGSGVVPYLPLTELQRRAGEAKK